ncbi:hypothetical protein CDAR_478531 [Caerostris darwini]|uniref:Uncharacterized protein n=1 Tax=Caerostris darwini TaxID=1538125 RepID=A0AAV4QQB1_9ARAC|nr:hypothetical protein CDAR_478531 [Caerostris darwini]
MGDTLRLLTTFYRSSLKDHEQLKGKLQLSINEVLDIDRKVTSQETHDGQTEKSFNKSSAYYWNEFRSAWYRI